MNKFATLLCTIAILFADPSDLPISSKEIRTIAIVPYGETSEVPMQEGAVWIDPKLDLPGNQSQLSDSLTPYLSRPITAEDLQEIEGTIAAFYRKHHRPIVSVIVPPQDLDKGTLRVVIIEATVEEITLKGNKWTSDKRIRAGSGIYINEKLNSYQMQRDLAWMNRSPFRRTDAVFSKGSRTAETKAELVTNERFPLRVYAGADNTGTNFLKHTRFYSGLNAGNLWGLDHLASLQWTTAMNHKTFVALTGQYTAPLPWRHQILLYGGYSWFKGDIPVQLMSQEGRNWQVSGRYQIPIAPIFGQFLQEFSFGYDYKRTNNDLIFGGLPFQTGFADINQFLLSYMLDYKTNVSGTSFRTELFAAPWKLSRDQSTAAYQRLRPGAKPEYAYARLRLSHTHSLSRGFSIRGVAAGQATWWNLLPSEEFGLGGYDTVRGYEERAFNADQGLMLSIEAVTPKIGLIKKYDALEFLVFADYGWGHLHKAFFDQKKTEWLMGVGPGVRYQFKTNIVFRCDVGFPLHKAGVGRQGTHYHIGGTMSY